MVDIELMGYKIKKIDMHNNLSESGLLQLQNSLEFSIDFADNNESAEATLFGYMRHRKNPDLFLLTIDVQAIFRVYGVKNEDLKDEASLKCYDDLFPYYKEIMTYIAENTGLGDFDLEKPEIFKQGMDSGVSESNDKGNSRIIILNPDIDA